MPSYSLLPHPDRPPLAVTGIVVEVKRTVDGLILSYSVDGTGRVVWPSPASSDRADELWRTTCFELFLRFDDERYVEFNFSPAGRWAAYAFDGYRDGMRDLAVGRAPVIAAQHGRIDVSVDLAGFPHGALAMALTAAIEEEGGSTSFWSLAHAAGPPDFHATACFAARLPPPLAQ